MTAYMQGANDAADGKPNKNPHKPFSEAWQQYEAGYRDALKLKGER